MNFGFGQGTARELHLIGTETYDLVLSADDHVALAWPALPVGFSWCLSLCQRVWENLAGSFSGTQAAVKSSDRGSTAVMDLAAAGVLCLR